MNIAKCCIDVSVNVDIEKLKVNVAMRRGFYKEDENNCYINRYSAIIADTSDCRHPAIISTEPIFATSQAAEDWGKKFLDLLKELPIADHRFSGGLVSKITASQKTITYGVNVSHG